MASSTEVWRSASFTATEALAPTPLLSTLSVEIHSLLRKLERYSRLLFLPGEPTVFPSRSVGPEPEMINAINDLSVPPKVSSPLRVSF